ncbi:MAG: hypothetical protein KC643_20485 [Nitrospira sp.]|nr:hypothetical protein [Nitrospira sp.]
MKRLKVGRFPQLNVGRLSRQGFLVPNTELDWGWNAPGMEQGNIQIRVQEGKIILRYLYGKAEILITEQVPIVSGEKRKWFQCPKCQRQAAILYGVNGRFHCRKCHGLVYPSQYPFHPDGYGRKLKTLRSSGSHPSKLEKNQLKATVY